MQKRTISDWEKYIGTQLKQLRLRKNMTQEEVAQRAGISIPTLIRLESGLSTSLSTFVSVVQVLGEEKWLESLAPDVPISPIQLKTLKKTRERASKRKND